MSEYGVPVTIHPAGQAKVSDGKSVVVTAPAGGVQAGLFYLIGGWFGAAFATMAAGVQIALNIEQAEYESTQITGTFTAGALLYWDAGTSRFTTTVGTNRLVGRVVAPIGTTGVRFILGPQV